MPQLFRWIWYIMGSACLCAPTFAQAQLPVPFFRQRVTDFEWNLPTQLEFDENGRMYVSEKAGQIYIIEDEVVREEPLIDISEEVMNNVDHGLLGFALHPNFLRNGYFYLLYTVDPHHLKYFGTPEYDPTKSEKETATIGRVTRYTADPSTDFTTVIPGSRKILLGEKPGEGFPILHLSHGVGSLVFGTDNTLLVSCGDGGTFGFNGDLGSNPETFYESALAIGIIDEIENVGGYRSQMINSLSGKILRIDPLSGEGLPSNPFFDSGNPGGKASKVWALGFRNPFRFQVQPETGSHNPADGNPGILFVGDVGWGEWEELNIVTEGGMNFGWPIFEGQRKRWEYDVIRKGNILYPNDASNAQTCNLPYFRFYDLIKEADQAGKVSFPNPCDPANEIPEEVPKFAHMRPMVSWANRNFNTISTSAEVPAFDAEGQPSLLDLNDSTAPATGGGFTGSCAMGGVFINHEGFPDVYQGRYFAVDYPHWIRIMDFDSAYQLTGTTHFFEEPDHLFIVDIKQHPTEACLYYIDYKEPRGPFKICYGGNPSPKVVLEVDRQFGPSPLTTNFKGSESFDPEDQPISFRWDFGDGSTSTEADPVHTYEATGNEPQSFSATLTVTDSAGASRTESIVISLNNTPPTVKLTSIKDGDSYLPGQPTLLPLLAEVKDQEHPTKDLAYAWQVFFQHNTHDHPEPIVRTPKSSFVISGAGCDEEEDYWYRVKLTVTDPEGLATVEEVELFPYCGSPLTVFDTLIAKPDNKQVTLSGMAHLAAETEIVVERILPDASIFEPIGSFQLSAGNQAFSYVDGSPELGVNQYRLRALSLSNLAEYSSEAAALFPKPAIGLAFPNPTLGEIKFQLRDNVQQAQLKIYTQLGQEVGTYTVEAAQLSEGIWTLDISDQLPGLYLFELITEGEVQVGKYIKDE